MRADSEGCANAGGGAAAAGGREPASAICVWRALFPAVDRPGRLLPCLAFSAAASVGAAGFVAGSTACVVALAGGAAGGAVGSVGCIALDSSPIDECDTACAVSLGAVRFDGRCAVEGGEGRIGEIGDGIAAVLAPRASGATSGGGFARRGVDGSDGLGGVEGEGGKDRIGDTGDGITAGPASRACGATRGGSFVRCGVDGPDSLDGVDGEGVGDFDGVDRADGDAAVAARRNRSASFAASAYAAAICAFNDATSAFFGSAATWCRASASLAAARVARLTVSLA